MLASASAGRLGLLRGAGIEPVVAVSGVDESTTDGSDADEITVELARRKALAVAPGHGGALVLGCDSLLELAGRLVGKPGSDDRARSLWRELRGAAGRLVTGHFLLDTSSGVCAVAAESTTVRFARPSDSEIDDLVASGEPLGVAGGFTLLGRASPFVESIDGSASNVIGLSLPLLRRMLREVGSSLAEVTRS